MKDWYLVYCKAKQEDTAASGLEEQGYRVYLPKLAARRRRSQGMVNVVQPLFPRYLFVALTDNEQSISPVQSTAGVSNLVRFGIDYTVVRQYMIEALQAREDPETGHHRISELNLRQGDQVHIHSGAFAGIEGVFEAHSGQDRVIVLFELLGRQIPTEIDVEDLAQ